MKKSSYDWTPEKGVLRDPIGNPETGELEGSREHICHEMRLSSGMIECVRCARRFTDEEWDIHKKQSKELFGTGQKGKPVPEKGIEKSKDLGVSVGEDIGVGERVG